MKSTLGHLLEHYQRTYDRVNWSKILEIAHDLHGDGVRCTFGALKWGGLHLVRFLQFENGNGWAARIPLLPREDRPWSMEEMEQIRLQMKSEHATRKYFNDTKCLPFSVPETYGYATSHDGDGVGLPWTLMTKLEGRPLIDFWRNPRQEDKTAVYRQFAEIYLALYRTRLPTIGSLFVRDGSDEIYVGPPVSPKVEGAPIPCVQLDGTPWSTALGYHTQWYNDRLMEIQDRSFGHRKWSLYTLAWLLRSFVPTFLTVGEQEQGFPLHLSDFHFRNFLATVDGDSPPKITGIIDFDGTTTATWATFALPPSCLDDPYDGNFEGVKECREDRALFLRQLEDLERASNPNLPLSTLFRDWRPRWLMHKLVEISSAPEECEFFNLVYGTDEDRAKDMFEYFDGECKQPSSKQAKNEGVDETRNTRMMSVSLVLY
jgi:Phosphotransferase enzyme family